MNQPQFQKLNRTSIVNEMGTRANDVEILGGDTCGFNIRSSSCATNPRNSPEVYKNLSYPSSRHTVRDALYKSYSSAMRFDDACANSSESIGPDLGGPRKRMRHDSSYQFGADGNPLSDLGVAKRKVRLRRRAKRVETNSVDIKPIEALAKRILHSVQETQPWTKALMRQADEKSNSKQDFFKVRRQQNLKRKQNFECEIISGSDSGLDKDDFKLEPHGRSSSIRQSRSLDNKKSIATYLNGDNKNLRWQTDLIEDAESDNDMDEEMMSIFGSSSRDQESEPTSESSFISQSPKTSISNEDSCDALDCEDDTNALASTAKGHLLACATAAITANFRRPSEKNGNKSTSRHNLTKNANASCGNYDRVPFNYSSFSNQSENTTITNDRPLEAFSEQLDMERGFNRVNMTKRRMTEQTSTLNLSIENLRLLAERNLVATLVGVYILISLIVMIVLILPYLFNLPRTVGSIENSLISEKVTGISFGSEEKLDNELDKHSTGFQSNRKQQSDSLVQLDTSALLQREDGYTGNDVELQNLKSNSNRSVVVAEIWSNLTKKEQFNLDGDTVPSDVDLEVLPGYRDSPKIPPVVQVKKTNSNAQVDTELKGQTVKEVQTLDDKRRLIAQSSQLVKKASEQSVVSGSYSALWAHVHNQECQPLTVPFCSKSFGSILANLGISAQQSLPVEASAPMFYDRTLLPNQFSRSRQSQIENVLEKYDPVVDIKCYALMPLFLCSLHAPKCIQVKMPAQVEAKLEGGENYASPKASKLLPMFINTTHRSNNPSFKPHANNKWARLVPPCRSLCREAFRKCTFFFEVLSLKLMNPEDCESLPESADPNVCVGQRECGWLQNATDNQVCQHDKFRCTDGECIPKKWRCDGFADCTDKSDEHKCSRCDVATQFYCGQDICIDKAQVCNGLKDCKDGRDERQCLRLSHAHGRQEIDYFGPRQLEVWSAIKDSWIPVCGAHWSAMPMSHQACQALGYSRANNTQILFRSADTFHVQLNVTSRDQLFKTENKLKSFTFLSDDQLSDEKSQQVDQRSLGDLINIESSGRDAENEQEVATDPARMPDAVDDVDNFEFLKGIRLSKSNRVDHLISYESLFDSALANLDLKSVDAMESELRSLSSFLYHGPEAGCNDRPTKIISTVHLQCLDFQCGRPVTSYSKRVHSNGQSASIATGTGLIRPESDTVVSRAGIAAKPLEHQLVQPTETVTESELTHRVQKIEAEEELDSNFDEADGNIQIDKIMEQVQQTNQSISARLVVGGIESMPGEFPYLASLHGGPEEVFFCGGVLISINWLLTAAHCVGNRTQPDGWIVKVGVTRRIASPAFMQKVRVRKIIKHPKFNQDTVFNNDIALILLEESVEFNQYIRPICLPAPNTRLGPDNSRDCVVVGFGKAKFSQDANFLQVAHFANVPIVDHTICSAWYAEQGITLTKGMLCAGYADGRRDACQGDSGSGLFCRYSKTNQFFAAGVVSFGVKCAIPKLPGVYTSVPSYVNWIESTTRDNS